MLRRLAALLVLVLAPACEAEDSPPIEEDATASQAASSSHGRSLPPAFEPGYRDREDLIQQPSDIPVFVDVAPYVGLADLAAGWGLSWNDFDDDGDADLWFSNHMHFPSELYVNRDGWSWQRSDLSIGRDVGLDDHMGIWADYDGDGDSDLYTTNGFYRPDHLFRNEGDGRLVEVTEEAGVTLGDLGRGRSAVWADLDGNGFHDLIVFNLYTRDLYYRSSGDGTFEEVAAEAGTLNALGKRGGLTADFDGDGDLDLYVPLSQLRNLLLINRGDGVFIDRSDGSGSDLLSASRSAACGDYDDDGDLDLYVTRADSQGDALLRNRGDATFEDVTGAAGIDVVLRGVRNAAFVDFDNDGDLDLYTTSGGSHDGENVPNRLLLNRGDGTFEDATGRANGAALAPGNTGAAAFGDPNGDGWIDIALTNGGGARAISGPHQLLRNLGTQDTREAHWARLHLRKASGSRKGLGARVVLTLGDRRIHRSDLPISTMSQDAPGIGLGLGPATLIEQVRVSWPDGTWTLQQSLPADRVHDIEAGRDPRALDSHPLALLGEVAAIDLDRIEQRLVERFGRERWPVPADAEIARRKDRVLAAWLAERLAADIEISDEDVAAAYQARLDDYRLPRRLWIDQVAAGKFTTFRRAPRLPWKAIQAAGDGLRAGDDALETVTAAGIRAWARIQRNDEEPQPYGVEDDSHRGYLESGWITEAGLVERYGEEIAAEVMAAPVGAVIGPFKRREGRDVQPPDLVWPVLRLFRVLAREESATLELPLVEKDLRRALMRERVREAIESETGRADHEARLEEGLWIEGVRYPVRAAAAAARREIGEGPLPVEIERAFARVEREAAIDAAILSWLAQRSPSDDELSTYVAAKRTIWTRPPRIEGTMIFAAGEELAKPVHEALLEGRPLDRVLEEMDIPSIDGRSARSNETYHERVVIDRAFAERVLRGDLFDSLSALEPGQCSQIFTQDGEHRMLVVSRQIPSEPPTPELAQRLAERELNRQQREQMLDDLFGE